MRLPLRCTAILVAVLTVATLAGGCRTSAGPTMPVKYADLPLVPVPDGAPVTGLTVLLTAFGRVEESHTYINGDAHKTEVIPLPAFLIQRGDKYLLVDTGNAPALATDPALYLGRCNAWLARNELKRLIQRPGWDVPARIQAMGIDPAKITDVVITHAHFDHTGANRAFLPATFHLTGETLHAGRHGGLLGGYIAADFPDEMKVQKVDFAGSKPLLSFAGSLDLFGDGSVYVVPEPGHSPGHVGVLVRTGHGLVLLAGDGAYVLGNIERPELIGYFDDREATWDTLCRLKRLMTANPDILIWPSHDPAVFGEQPSAPQTL